MATINYNISAVSVSIWFNKYGDHDHNGLMYIHSEYEPILDYVKSLQQLGDDVAPTPDIIEERNRLIAHYKLTGNTIRINEWLPDEKQKPSNRIHSFRL